LRLGIYPPTEFTIATVGLLGQGESWRGTGAEA
jgi:hypothetical protein